MMKLFGIIGLAALITRKGVDGFSASDLAAFADEDVLITEEPLESGAVFDDDYETLEEVTGEGVLQTVRAFVDPPTRTIAGGLPIIEWEGKKYNNKLFDVNFYKIFPRQAWKTNTLPIYPNLIRFGEKIFDKTDGDWVEKKYTIQIVTADCRANAYQSCSDIFAPGEYLAVVTNDKVVRTCIENLSPACEVNIGGTWNFTRTHPPDLCVSHSVSMRLPSPGGIVPRRDCIYERLKLWSTAFRGENWSTIEDMYKRGRGVVCDISSGPYWKNCRAGIQWGKDIPTKDCRRRDYRDSILMKDEEWGYENSGFLWRSLRMDPKREQQSVIRSQYDGYHVNLFINFEATRVDRDADGFIWSEGSITNSDRLGSFYGADVAFKCTTRGQNNIYTREEVPGNVIDVSRK